MTINAQYWTGSIPTIFHKLKMTINAQYWTGSIPTILTQNNTIPHEIKRKCAFRLLYTLVEIFAGQKILCTCATPSPLVIGLHSCEKKLLKSVKNMCNLKEMYFSS